MLSRPGRALPLVPELTVIAPTGELDLAGATAFRTAVQDTRGATTDGLIVDLSDVEFIDSSGLAVILEVDEQLRRRQRRVAVVAPRGTSAAVLLTLAGLRGRLRVFDSRAAARRQ
jgi:anti-sigma B factor antagonist